MKKKLLSVILGMCVLAGSVNISAASLPAAEEEANYEVISTSIDTAIYGNPGENRIQPRANYNVSSKVDKCSKLVNGSKEYYADGWVSLIDKNSGKGVYHYSNAAMEDRSGWYTIVWAESGRKWDTGTAYATSPTTSANVKAYIYYGTEN